MSSPSTIELELAERYGREHAQVCRQARPAGLARRLLLWREQRLVRRALKVAGEPGLVLDLACGAGRFWPLLAEHANRVILAADPSQLMLDHAQTHHPGSLLKRIQLFKSSVFAIDLPSNSVDSIFCMQLFHHVQDSEHRLAMLQEFYRVTRDTLIVSLAVARNPGARGTAQRDNGQRWVIDKAEVEAQFAQAGFSQLKHYDVLPGCAQGRIYILRKDA